MGLSINRQEEVVAGHFLLRAAMPAMALSIVRPQVRMDNQETEGLVVVAAAQQPQDT
ncbi:MAG: hypothetical protein KUF75_11270 [Candidatus Thiodiazotropha sp. (ex Ctena orbiculata)]|nr:hypothetical protein [Candidatus Thiodiazotropha taylori]